MSASIGDVRAVIDPAFPVALLDRRVAGSFVEHMGRCVYGGLFEPGHSTADADGWRGDVLDLVRQLGVTTVRYPGGNFVSGYDWEDGVGPRSARPVRRDLAWRSLESNQVGTDEFLAWARLAGVEPIMAVNLGTRGLDAARALVEYCNGEAGSHWSDLRVANGHADPWNVRMWCLGNEMDGPWQVGHKTAVEYGRLAAEAGKAMRLVDPTIELILCGSSSDSMATFGGWDDTVLDLAWDVTDHLSVHRYFDPATYPDTGAWLAAPLSFERQIRSVIATADAVAARRRSRKRITLAVDEWNVWHMKANPHSQRPEGPFRHAPAIAEDRYTLADALMVGGLLLVLLRNADRVSIACLAQLVNVIAPIGTLTGGPAWRQSIFWPVRDVFTGAHGTVLRVEPDGPTYAVEGEGDVAAVDAVAVHDRASGSVSVFALNRTPDARAFVAPLRDLGPLRVVAHSVLTGADLMAGNTPGDPDRVRPQPGSGAGVDRATLTVTLPGPAWAVTRRGAGGARAGGGAGPGPAPGRGTGAQGPLPGRLSGMAHLARANPPGARHMSDWPDTTSAIPRFPRQVSDWSDLCRKPPG